MRATTRLFKRLLNDMLASATEPCPRRCHGGLNADGSTCPSCAGSGVYFRL